MPLRLLLARVAACATSRAPASPRPVRARRRPQSTATQGWSQPRTSKRQIAHRRGSHGVGLEPAVGSGACWLSLQGPSGRPRLHPRACSTRGLCVQAEGLRCAALPAKAGGCPLQRCLTRPLPLVATRAHRLFGGQAADSDGFTTPPRRLEALSSHAESFQASTHELSDPVKHVEGST